MSNSYPPPPLGTNIVDQGLGHHRVNLVVCTPPKEEGIITESKQTYKDSIQTSTPFGNENYGF